MLREVFGAVQSSVVVRENSRGVRKLAEVRESATVTSNKEHGGK